MDSKFLIFSLADEFFGLPISRIREIIRHESITPIHDTIPCVRGVINLRGKIITIFDTRERFGMSPKEYDRHTVFIICEVTSQANQTYLIGMAVDAVHQVEFVTDSSVKHPQSLGLSISSEYLTGIIHGNQGLTQLIEIDRIVADMKHPDGAANSGSETVDIA